MARPSKSNVPAAALRWSIERAGIEFGLASQTLRKSLAKSSATPDRDGLFSTKQIVAAIYGSMHIEKLATQKELRKKLELENAITTAINTMFHAYCKNANADCFVSISHREISSGL
jgi:hypothetical protein